MNKNRLILVSLMVLPLIFGNIAFADDGWEASITVKVLNAENKLSFGQRPDATDGYDGPYDVPAMLSGDIKAYFQDSETKYWRDIKAITNSENKTWDLWIGSSLNGEMVKIQWAAELLPINTILIDNDTGAVIDMKTEESYSYQNNGQRQFMIEVAP